MKEEKRIFDNYVKEEGLNASAKRDCVLKAFLGTKKHVSAEELYSMVKKECPEIGYTTVYRTLKMIADCGLAELVDFEDGVKRFEPRHGKEDHAHFICTECGKSFEVFAEPLRNLGFELAKAKGFVPQKQRFEIFGLCNRCKQK
ncbi:MAG: transcriptional repressor [Candidatus Omnitrophota bacterium]